MAGLAGAMLLVLLLWSQLLWAAWLVGCGVATGWSTFAALLPAMLLALATRRTGRRRGRGDSALLWSLGLSAGLLSYPACASGIGVAGALLGLAARVPVPASGGDPVGWLTMIGLAPLLEELVYRERLLPALRPLGIVPALLLSSAAFALPHLEPWAMLASFLVGLALGAVMWLGGSVAVCIGLHLGLNLAATLRPPAVAAGLPDWLAGAVGVGLLIAALGFAARTVSAQVPVLRTAALAPGCTISTKRR